MCTLWKNVVSVRNTHFWCNVWKVFCFCAQYTFLIYRLESVLCKVHISYVPSGKCSVSVHSTYFWCTVWKVFCAKYTFLCTVWKVFCFCAQYTFLMYRLESVLFLCTVHISDVPSRKCSVTVHSIHFSCTVWKVFCAQYKFLMYRLESILFLCTVYISEDQWFDISISNRFLVQDLCLSHCCVVMSPYWRQFLSLSNM
jgi:hypothetical protein